MGFSACREYEKTEVAEVQFNIFAGLTAQRGEFPYIVALGYEDKDEDSNSSQVIKYKCGGTLISLQHVLTAAHCVRNVQENVPTEASNERALKFKAAWFTRVDT